LWGGGAGLLALLAVKIFCFFFPKKKEALPFYLFSIVLKI
jgi:hypothetical protein